MIDEFQKINYLLICENLLPKIKIGHAKLLWIIKNEIMTPRDLGAGRRGRRPLQQSNSVFIKMYDGKHNPIISGKHNPTMGGKLRPAIDMLLPFRPIVRDVVLLCVPCLSGADVPSRTKWGIVFFHSPWPSPGGQEENIDFMGLRTFIEDGVLDVPSF